MPQHPRGQHNSGKKQQEQEHDQVRTRSVRVEDSLWEDAMTACQMRRDPNLSFVIRRMLERYVRDTPRVVQQQRGG